LKLSRAAGLTYGIFHHSLTHTHTHTHTLSLLRNIGPLYISFARIFTHTHIYTLSLSHRHTHTLSTLSLSYKQQYTQHIFASSLCHTHTYTLSFTHTNKHTNTLSHSPSHATATARRGEATPIYSRKDTRDQCRVAFFPYRRKGGFSSSPFKVLFIFILFFNSSNIEAKMNTFLVSSAHIRGAKTLCYKTFYGSDLYCNVVSLPTTSTLV